MEKDGKPSKIKHFWAFAVYNYQEKRIQILEVTQKGVMTTMKAYITDEAWGSPKGYDFVVTKSGKGLDTEYAVITNPHTPVDADIQKEYEAKTIDLTALDGDTQAWRAVSIGKRTGLKIHAGAIGANNTLRPTHGCIRVDQSAVTSLLKLFISGDLAYGPDGVRVVVEEL